jgi:hypothetical protein
MELTQSHKGYVFYQCLLFQFFQFLFRIPFLSCTSFRQIFDLQIEIDVFRLKVSSVLTFSQPRLIWETPFAYFHSALKKYD